MYAMDKVLLTIKYVDGDLNHQEHEAFERAIKTDTELRGYLAYYKEINRNITAQLRDALGRNKQQVSDVSETYVAEKLDFKLDYFWFFGWAVVLLVALMLWKPWKTNLFDEYGFNNQSIAEKLFVAPYQGFQQAAQYLEKKDYYEAKQIVSKSFIQNPTDFKLASYYAMLLISDNCLEIGREVLYPFASASSEYQYDAAYMLALSYLKAGDNENCVYWLKRINNNSSYYNQSKQLMQKIVADGKANPDFI